MLALVALLVVGVAFAVATHPAGAIDQIGGPAPTKHPAEQRLVVRGDATFTDARCDAGVCIELDGQFPGTPVGTGAYSGAIRLSRRGVPQRRGRRVRPDQGP